MASFLVICEANAQLQDRLRVRIEDSYPEHKEVTSNTWIIDHVECEKLKEDLYPCFSADKETYFILELASPLYRTTYRNRTDVEG